MSFAPVHDIGRYRLIVELARGGMGVVYLAVVRGPAGFSKLVVLKELKSDLAEDPTFLQMFLDEARISARLSHPNVVQTNEIGSAEDANGRTRHFIVMEFLEGQPLHRIVARLSKGKRLSAQGYARLIVDVLGGLHHAHELVDFDGRPLEVVHRDISPHNVFLTYDGQVKVVDFGIAKAADVAGETRTGVLKGKVAYMAPEQARGLRVDRRADVFSVGAMLWEAAAGERLWSQMSEVAVLATLTSSGVPSPRTINADVDPELERIVMKACAADREQRYRTAAAMQADLERWLGQQREVPTTRALGAVVAEAFANERRELRGVIEQQLGSLADAHTGELSALPMAKISSPSVTGSVPAARLDDFALLRGSGTHPGRAALTPTHGGASTIDASGAAPRRRWAFAVGALALVAGGAVATFALRRPAPNEPVRGIAGAPLDPERTRESFRGLPRGVPESSAEPGASASASASAATSADVAPRPNVMTSGRTTARGATSASATPSGAPSAASAPTSDATSTPPATATATAAPSSGRPKRKIDTDDPYKLP